MKQLFIILVVVTLLTGCSDDMHSGLSDNFAKSTYDSVGERIYLSGQSNSGNMITPIGGHHHMKMHGGSCATCHGADRSGGVRMWPRFWITAPPLTPVALLGDHESDGHAHDVYDRDSLKTAIVDGINPTGEKLNDLMPRWQMSSQDLEALVRFLLVDDHQG